MSKERKCLVLYTLCCPYRLPNYNCFFLPEHTTQFCGQSRLQEERQQFQFPVSCIIVHELGRCSTHWRGLPELHVQIKQLALGVARFQNYMHAVS